jgi:hypothetical protein
MYLEDLCDLLGTEEALDRRRHLAILGMTHLLPRLPVHYSSRLKNRSF